MPRPTTKKQLLETIETERNALEQFLAGLSPEQMTQPGIVGEWSVKDVLAHLLEWQYMVLNWYVAGVKGKVPAVPSEDLNWGQLPQLNQRIYEKHCHRPLADIEKEFRAACRKTLNTIQTIPEGDLFERGCYAWTRNNSLGSYFVSCTSSHYRWARTTMKKGLKAVTTKSL